MSMLVLIADDEPVVCDFLGEFLSRRGHQVKCALDGKQTLRALREEPPDLLLLDLYMPEVDGLGVLRRIRDEGLSAGTIWSMTGKGDHEAAEQSLRLGASDFFTKPVDLQHLDWRLELEQRHRA